MREWEAGDRSGGGNDLVLDFTELGALDLQFVSLLFTAREKAVDEDREVWVAGLPETFWIFLRTMGLEEFFHLLPEEAEIEA